MSRQRGNRWQADALVDGKRIRKSFGTMREADAWEAANRPVVPLALTRVEPVETMLAMAIRLEELLWGRGTQSQSARRTMKEVERILGPIPMRDFNFGHIELLEVAFLKSGNAYSTMNRKFAILSKLCRRAVDAKVLAEMPKFKRRKEPKGRDRALTWEDEDRIFTVLKSRSQRSHDLAVFLVDTGCRLGEPFTLEWHWINWATNQVTFDKTKADLTRSVPMTSRVVAILKANLASGDATPFGEIKRHVFRGHWNAARIAAGYKGDTDIVPHILRHTNASRIVTGTGSLVYAQKMLGHRSPIMTNRYTHFLPDTLNPVLAALERK